MKKKSLRNRVVLAICNTDQSEIGWIGGLANRILRLIRDDQKRKCEECLDWKKVRKLKGWTGLSKDVMPADKK